MKYVLAALAIAFAAPAFAQDPVADRVQQLEALAARKAARVEKAKAKDSKAACECGCEQTGTCGCAHCNDHTADKKNPGASGPVLCECGCRNEPGSCTCHDCNHVLVMPKAQTHCYCSRASDCICGDSCQCYMCLCWSDVDADGYCYLMRHGQAVAVDHRTWTGPRTWTDTGYAPYAGPAPTSPLRQPVAPAAAPACRS